MSHHTEEKVIASTAHIWNWFETNTKENQFWSREIAMLVNSLLRIIIQRHTQHRYSFFRDWLLGHAHPITKTLSLSCKHYFWDRVSLCSTTGTTLQYLNQCESRLCSAHFIPSSCCCVGLLCCEAVSSLLLSARVPYSACPPWAFSCCLHALQLSQNKTIRKNFIYK